MNISSYLTDDQLAIAGCFGALFVSGLVLMLSNRLGISGRRVQSADRQVVSRLPQARSARTSDRKAA